MGKRYFSDKIVKWYVLNGRPLPWRDTADPYMIWLSEVILQQTRVSQGLPYYEKFIETYPTVRHLAQAPEQQVLRLWQGLGYYSRARNLHKCAKAVVTHHNGTFPGAYDDLLKLPGIGPYTAAAIASFAFGQAVAVLDGNVFRILSRIFGIDTPINSPEGHKVFTQLANELLSKKSPAKHNQAAMEFGALFCTPHRPQCHECTFKSTCFAYRNDLVEQLPVKIRKRAPRKRYFFYLVVEKDKALLMKRRQDKDIWQGLFDFALIERNQPVKPEKLIAETKELFQQAEMKQVSKAYKHLLTHQTIHCRFIHLEAGPSFALPGNAFTFYSPDEVAQLPKPALITRFLEDENRY